MDDMRDYFILYDDWTEVQIRALAECLGLHGDTLHRSLRFDTIIEQYQQKADSITNVSYFGNGTWYKATSVSYSKHPLTIEEFLEKFECPYLEI